MFTAEEESNGAYELNCANERAETFGNAEYQKVAANEKWKVRLVNL